MSFGGAPYWGQQRVFLLDPSQGVRHWKSGNSPLANAHSKPSVSDRCSGCPYRISVCLGLSRFLDFWHCQSSFFPWRGGFLVVSFRRGGLAGFAASSQLSGIWQAQLVLIGHCASRPGFLRSACSVLNSTAPTQVQLRLNLETPPCMQGWLSPKSALHTSTSSTANRQWATTGCCNKLHARARKANRASFFHDAILSEQLVTQARVRRVTPRQSERVEIPPDCHSISSRLGLSQRTSLCWSLPCDPYAARCAATLRALMQLPYGRQHQ